MISEHFLRHVCQWNVVPTASLPWLATTVTVTNDDHY